MCWIKGSHPPDIEMKDIGQKVRWGPEPILVQEGPPLAPLLKVPEEESGIVLAQEDGATMEDDSTA